MSEIAQWDGKVLKPLFKTMRKSGSGIPLVLLALKVVEYIGNGPHPHGKHGKRIKWSQFDQIVLIGQSHLDAAWRWRSKQGIIKARATFKKALKHIDEIPHFTYTQPSPQYYQWIKDTDKDYLIELWPKIKKAVAEGRWIPNGGCWVEPDTNLPSGESLVRQRLYGQRFYLKEFGFVSDLEFLQDCFGFNWNLPQIFRKSGATMFGTGKLFWNKNTKIPVGMALWQAPDGTQLPMIHINFGYFIPMTYGKDYPLVYLLGKPGKKLIADYRTPAKKFAEWRSREYMMEQPFGYGLGDGGHGPIEGELLVVEGMRKIYPKKIKHHQKGDIPAMLKKYYSRWAIWTDEWYLDTHRGTYTSVSRVKRGNRETEHEMEICERLATISNLFGHAISKENLEANWKLVLYNQFHDILPGSSCPEVYLDYDKDRVKVNSFVNESLKDIYQFLLSNAKINTKYGKPFLIFNSLSWKRSGIIEVKIGSEIKGVLRDSDGKILPTSIVSDRWGSLNNNPKSSIALGFICNLPPMGYKIFYFDSSVDFDSQSMEFINSVKFEENSDVFLIENEFIQVKIDKRTGLIPSIISKDTDSEFLNQPGNILRLFEEKEHCDAWNIDPKYMENPIEYNLEDSSIEIIEQTPLRCTLEITRKIKLSTYIQRISLAMGVPYIITAMDIDMKDPKLMVKLEFDTKIKTSIVTAEIPYAYIDRTVKPTTVIDKARWEHACQKWVSISDETQSMGFTLLNNGKYAYNVLESPNGGTILRPTVLRTPNHTGYAHETKFVNRAPDGGIDPALPRFTDIEYHKDIKYGIVTHKNGWKSGVWRYSFELNLPMRVDLSDFNYNIPSQQTNIPSSFSLFSIDQSNVKCGALKIWEDDPNPDHAKTIIIRLVEQEGLNSKIKLTFDGSFNIESGDVVDLLEITPEPNRICKIHGNFLETEITPYEIMTLRIKMA